LVTAADRTTRSCSAALLHPARADKHAAIVVVADHERTHEPLRENGGFSPRFAVFAIFERPWEKKLKS